MTKLVKIFSEVSPLVMSGDQLLTIQPTEGLRGVQLLLSGIFLKRSV